MKIICRYITAEGKGFLNLVTSIYMGEESKNLKKIVTVKAYRYNFKQTLLDLQESGDTRKWMTKSSICKIYRTIIHLTIFQSPSKLRFKCKIQNMLLSFII